MFKKALLCVITLSIFIPSAEAYTPGDANSDSNITLADVIYLVNFIFRFGYRPHPVCSGETVRDGMFTSSDIIFLVDYLFKAGPAPAASGTCCP